MGLKVPGVRLSPGKERDFLHGKRKKYNRQTNKKTNKISKVDLALMLNNIIKDIIKKEKSGYTYNMLCKCSKFQLTLFICLTSCVSHYSDKILLPNFYNHFKGITSKYLAKRSHYDLILIQKYLEDLNNCNLISIKNELNSDNIFDKIYKLIKF